MLAAREEKSRAAWREKLAVDFDVLGGAVKRRDRSGAGFVGKFDSGGNANRSDVAGEIEDAERRSFHAGLDAMEAGGQPYRRVVGEWPELPVDQRWSGERDACALRRFCFDARADPFVSGERRG